MSNESLSGSSASSNVPTTPQSRTGVVFVHGAGIWRPDFYEPIANALQGCIDGGSMPTSFGALGACYSDVINSVEAKTARATAFTSREDAFVKALMWNSIWAGIALTTPELFFPKFIGNLFQSLMSGGGVPSIEKVWNAMSSTLLYKSLDELRDQITQTVQDVCFYLRDDPKFVGPIRQELIDKLHDAQQYDEIVLVSHSLGTIVAFDVLNAWTESKPRIAYWFTLGCPLTWALRLRDNTPTRLNNDKVQRWYNVFDTSDIVASPLCPRFSKPGDNILDIFVNVGIGPVDSHNYLDYRTPTTTLRLIADAVRATNQSGNQ